MSIKEEFEKWTHHLKVLDLPVSDMILPSLSKVFVHETLTGLGLDCPDELVELYNCTGGIKAPEGIHLNNLWMFGSFYLTNFNDAVENYRVFRNDNRWDKSWFPVFENGGGDFCSPCCVKERTDWGQIWYFMLDSVDVAYIEYSSLSNMLKVINECFERGFCKSDEAGFLITNHHEAMMVAMRLNRNLPYYKP